jgi:arginine utilization regulatory protein
MALRQVLETIDEGIHIVDCNGTTIYYNKAMSDIEGLSIESVMGRNLLDLFPSLSKETSTLLRVLENGKPIKDKTQNYVNVKGKEITSINSTFPIHRKGRIEGALEIAKDITGIKEMSERILTLQEALNRTGPTGQGGFSARYTFEDIVGNNHIFINTMGQARMLSNTSSTILIYGETGTGKELFAHSIHNASRRRGYPFLAQNCAALPESLLEGILFGTVKGGFTGAVNRPGLFEQADGGTLLLDEINSMGHDLQAKLLRVLQDGYVQRIGEVSKKKVDVRVIATTNTEPLEIVEKGILRKDLYYRLSVVTLIIPPLRDRRDDIPLLIEHFTQLFATKLKKEELNFTQEVVESFENYPWPGNVRELANTIESLMNLTQRSLVDYDLLKAISKGKFNMGLSNDYRQHLETERGLNKKLGQIEKEILHNTLRENHGNISRSAKILGISRQNLQYKIAKYKIEVI